MKQYDVIIFDFDGTLVDTVYDIRDGFNLVLKEFGYPSVDIEKSKEAIGNGLNMALQCVMGLDDINHEHIQKGVLIFKEYYNENCCNKTCLFDGVRELLEKYKNKILSIISNKPENDVVVIADKLNIKKYFTDIIGGDRFPEMKPDPYPLNFLIDKYKVKKEKVIMIGDSYTDIDAAVKAGIDSIFITQGYGNLNHCEPTYTINNFLEIL